MRLVEKDFDSRLAKFKNKVVKFKGCLSDFVKKYEKIPVDLIYIDGCHQYDGAKSDLIIAKTILQPKIFSGHDYCFSWPGVVKAVDEILGKPDKTYSDGSWLKYSN